MPYDQEANPVLDVSGSAPKEPPKTPPAPPPKDFTAGPDDPAIVRLAQELNEVVDQNGERQMTQGCQAGFTKASADAVLAEQEKRKNCR